jgi:hypothetical protein
MVPAFSTERPTEDVRVISLADYRRRRFAPSEDDSTPPPPCPLGARPAVVRVETKSSPRWHPEPRLRHCRTS